MNEKGKSKRMSWQTFALMTVLFWGVYGVLLHTGRSFMPGVSPPGPDGANAGLKAFLLVCVAYGITGVIALIVLKARGSNYSFTNSGVSWSLIAGLAGALGAFTLVLALGYAGSPVDKGGGGLGAAAAFAVMPIVFGGAPMVNAITNMLLHPPEGGIKALPWQFAVGCVLAATGAYLVAKHAPSSAASKPTIAVEAKH